MKKENILFFSLILVSLLAFPCSAWEQSFEGSTADLPTNLFYQGSGVDFSIGASEHGHAEYYSSINQGTCGLFIREPWAHYLSFSYNTTGTNGNSRFYLQLFYENNTEVTAVYPTNQPITVPSDGNWHRIECIGNAADTQIKYYVDGVQVGTGTITYSNANVTKMYVMTQNFDAFHWYLDDFSDLNTIISTDSVCNTTDAGQYYRVGFPISASSYWYSKVFSPSGEQILYKQESGNGITPFQEHLIPNLTTTGPYRISLFRHDNNNGNDFIYTSKTFMVSESGSSTLDDLSYYLYASPSPLKAGEQLHISSHIPTNTTGYKIKATYSTSTGVINSEYMDITEQDHTSLWTVPATASGGLNYVYLLDPTGNVKASYQYTISGGKSNPTLVFSKSQYLPTDDIYLKYTNIPAGAELYIFELVGDTYTEPQESSISGNGNLNYKLKNKEAKEIYATVNKNTDLVSASADVANGFYILKGQVYDATTKAPISNAEVDLDNDTSTTQYTDSTGAYNFTASVGSHVVFINKAGYASAWNNVILSTDINTQNFYLNPEYVASGGAGSLYGITTDSVTGKTLGSAYIQIKNGSTVYSALSRSDTGSYVFDSNDLVGTWTLTATKTGYDVYSTQVILNGNIYYQIKLHPISSGSSGGSDGSGSSGGSDNLDSSGRSTTDRPDLESAKTSLDWLESVMPGLIKLVVLIFLLALVGVKF